MSIDEAIKHAEEVAESRCDECGREHKQLALWLKELKEYREQNYIERAVLDQIRAEIKQEYDNQGDWSFNDGLAFALDIIDKYKTDRG